LALSSVQLFIERVLRNLEPQVSPTDIDPDRWEWMKRYRVWQANREVFLWPENWLYPELRDDQSPFFQQTMSSLLQSDITDDAAANAYLDYLTSLEEVAKLEPCGLFYVAATSPPDAISYVVARTAGAHRKHYFRQLQGGSWSPWTEVKIDCEDMPLTPIVWNGRLFLFWLKILKQSPVSPSDAIKPSDPKASKKKLTDSTIGEFQSAGPSTAMGATKVAVNAVLCWTEFYNGKWQPTKTSDVNKPATIGVYDPSGPGSFDVDRNLVRILRAKYKAPGSDKGASFPALSDDSLILVITPSPTANAASPTSTGFVLHNTHSAPILIEDMRVPTKTEHGVEWTKFGDSLHTPAASRAMTPIQSYSGANLTGQFKITYNENNGPTHSNTLLGFDWMPRFVESQPGLTDLVEPPFIYEDRRNLFYVTTQQPVNPYSLFKGFGVSLPILKNIGSSIDMSSLSVGHAPGPSDVSLHTSSLSIGLSSKQTFTFTGGVNFTSIGSDKAALSIARDTKLGGR
jgi:hypothetical protein